MCAVIINQLNRSEHCYLGADDADLQASIDMYSTVRLTTDTAADGVRNAYDESTTATTVPQCQQSVSSFT